MLAWASQQSTARTLQRLWHAPARTFASSSTVWERVILGIESSCDDSCASVVTDDRRILSNVVLRQDHSDTKGIHPLFAARGHHTNIPTAIATALKDAELSIHDVDGIAVTRGPGMASSLTVGMSAAKTLAAVHEKPLIYVHHMRAHALTPLLTEADPPTFPFLCLLVSGGHTLVVLVQSHARFQVLATTLDDSIGNTFDKFARELGLPWQSASGALVEQLAREHEQGGESLDVKLPKVMLGHQSFSYSGLKSSVSRAIASLGGSEQLSLPQKRALAYEFQCAAFAQLEDKLVRAVVTRPVGRDSRLARGWRLADSDAQTAELIDSVVCSGGVASNQFLRDRLRIALDECGRGNVKLYFPPLALCTDNAAMIAWAGHLDWGARTDDQTPHVIPKWPLD